MDILTAGTESIRTRVKTLLVIVVLGFGVLSAGADVRSVGSSPELFAEAKQITAQQAMAVVRRSTGGRVVSAMPTKDGGFKVRVLLPNGRVKTVRVDSSGSIR